MVPDEMFRCSLLFPLVTVGNVRKGSTSSKYTVVGTEIIKVIRVMVNLKRISTGVELTTIERRYDVL